jgi:putative phosphoribosyl transferase
MYFRNRTEAGHLLARLLEPHKDRDDVLVLALPRGGVPVGYQVAAALKAPLDVFIVRKLGAPDHEELAMGAIASGGVRILNDDVIRQLDISPMAIESATEREQQELERREQLYRGNRLPASIRDRVIIVVDDGLATGSTMKAALEAIRLQQPSRLIVAVPTAPSETCEELRKYADEVICALTPEPFYAVGGSYGNFEQTTDDEVRDLIDRGAA